MTNQRDQKLYLLIQKKLLAQQNILTIQQILYFPLKSSPIQDILIITTHNLFFVYTMQIKKILSIKCVNYLTLAILGNQVILHCQKNQWVRIESKAIVSIIGNLLYSKEKFYNQRDKFTVHLEIQRTLEAFTLEAETHKKSIWNIFSKKSTDKDLRSSSRRTSFCTIDVSQKNFMLQVGKKVYKAIYQNAQLLCISGQATGFRFDSQNYSYLQLSPTQTIYSKQSQQQKSNKKRYLRRKIQKLSKYQAGQVHNNLAYYKENNYNQHILFALQLDTHFQIITQIQHNCMYAKQYLQRYTESERGTVYQTKVEQQVKPLSQAQLRSIFHKLHAFIEQQSQKKHILSSLSPQFIYMGLDQTRISGFMCKILSRLNLNYISPQQFPTLCQRLSRIQSRQHLLCSQSLNPINMIQQKQIKQSFSQVLQQFTPPEIYKINLWKIGLVLYQLTYNLLPFNIEYVAYKMKNKEHIKLHFPQYDGRSIQLHHFFKSILCKDPYLRGTRMKGQAKMSVLNPIISNVTGFLFRLWIINGSKRIKYEPK